MLDFNNLTEQQMAFFTALWEQHAQQGEQESESEKSFNTYIEQRRRQEAEQEKAAVALKARLI